MCRHALRQVEEGEVTLSHVPLEGIPQALILNGLFQNRLDITHVFSAREVSIVALGADADHRLRSGRRVYPIASLDHFRTAIRNEGAAADLQEPCPENAVEIYGAPQCHHQVPFEAAVGHDHAPDSLFDVNGAALCTDEAIHTKSGCVLT
jgi:hypothetical protein